MPFAFRFVWRRLFGRVVVVRGGRRPPTDGTICSPKLIYFHYFGGLGSADSVFGGVSTAEEKRNQKTF